MGQATRAAGHFATVDRTLRATGYEPRPPSGEVAAQDQGTCQRLACGGCSRPGLTYHPYVMPDRRAGAARYRAFAVCSSCLEAFEF